MELFSIRIQRTFQLVSTQDAEQERGRTRQGFILRQGVQDRYTGQCIFGRSAHKGQEHLRVQQEQQRG